MLGLGVVEGFFGPQWSKEARWKLAPLLARAHARYYIYAPKQDAYLRKNWKGIWDQGHLNYIKQLSQHYRSHGMLFGVALSPFGLDRQLSSDDRRVLAEKLYLLESVNVDLLGLFFDDMPSFQDIGKVQIEVVSFIQDHFHKKIIFCPTYYTPDPILEKVFGKMPEDYWETIAQGIPKEVEIAWTGPKVISSEISQQHLLETELLLKRRPFLWDNFFANDGPKNCKFLKLQAFSGRSKDAFEGTSGWALNLMNQPYLSALAFLSASKVFIDGKSTEESFLEAIHESCPKELASLIEKRTEVFTKKGLDLLSPEEKQLLTLSLSGMKSPVSDDIIDWLNGLYLVGSECLTD